MKKEDYWIKFWQQNGIVRKPTPHEKVGRTINGVPIEDEAWAAVLDDLQQQINLNENDDLLDIGAGSGVISIPFSTIANSVTAVDISEPLLREMAGIEAIKTIHADARALDFETGSFSKIIIYFAIQHFSEEETAVLLQKAFCWLRPGGLLFIGDVPDVERRFAFFNTPERVGKYFESLLHQAPIIGTWFHRDFFVEMGRYIGFSEITAQNQPTHYINAHYRFDVLMKK